MAGSPPFYKIRLTILPSNGYAFRHLFLVLRYQAMSLNRSLKNLNEIGEKSFFSGQPQRKPSHLNLSALLKEKRKLKLNNSNFNDDQSPLKFFGKSLRGFFCPKFNRF